MEEKEETKMVDTCRSQIDDIALNTLKKLNEIYVDLGYLRGKKEKEFDVLVDETREFFNSKLLPKLALRGMQ